MKGRGTYARVGVVFLFEADNAGTVIVVKVLTLCIGRPTQFLVDGVNASADDQVRALVASSALAHFKKTKVKGRHIPDLDAPTAEEFKAFDAAQKAASAASRDSENAHRDMIKVRPSPQHSQDE